MKAIIQAIIKVIRPDLYGSGLVIPSSTIEKVFFLPSCRGIKAVEELIYSPRKCLSTPYDAGTATQDITQIIPSYIISSL